MTNHSRAEERAHTGALAPALILLGGAIAAVSAGLVWAKADPASLGTGVPALFVNETALLRRGFDLRVGWLNVGWAAAACGICAAALLLWGANAAWVAKAQMALGIAILLLALLHLSRYPGVPVAAAGGALIAVGAYLSARGAR